MDVTIVLIDWIMLVQQIYHKSKWFNTTKAYFSFTVCMTQQLAWLGRGGMVVSAPYNHSGTQA